MALLNRRPWPNPGSIKTGARLLAHANMKNPQQRTMAHFRVVEHTARCQPFREWPGATEPGQAGNLKLAVKQYIPKTNPKPSAGDVTFIGAHANGFPKETYEPLWDELYERMSALGRGIRSIWIADAAHQGQSGVLNERVLGDDPSWWDHGRDLLGLIMQRQDDFPHPIIGIGHSMGGTQLTHLALMYPSLFQALVLMDPVIQTENPSKPYALASTYRRDIWPTRTEAVEKFRKNKFFQAWDPRVLERFLAHSFRDVPTELYPEDSPAESGEKPVTLTTTKAQELFTFLRPTYQDGRIGLQDGQWRDDMHPDDRDETYPFYRPEPPQVFRRLPELRPSVLYVFGERSELSTPDLRREKIEATGTAAGGNGGVRRGQVHHVNLPTGHFVPMELAGGCAFVSAGFSHKELTRWEEGRRVFREKWEDTPRGQKIAIDDRWKGHIGPLPGRSKM